MLWRGFDTGRPKPYLQCLLGPAEEKLRSRSEGATRRRERDETRECQFAFASLLNRVLDSPQSWDTKMTPLRNKTVRDIEVPQWRPGKAQNGEPGDASLFLLRGILAKRIRYIGLSKFHSVLVGRHVHLQTIIEGRLNVRRREKKEDGRGRDANAPGTPRT